MARKRNTKWSKAARKGWVTRRRNARREFLRRSRAAKKGWRRRKAKEEIVKAAKKRPTKKGKLREWIVIWTYNGAATRSVDFVVIARSEADAELFVVKAVAAGKDSNGADLSWMNKIPWDTRETVPFEEEHGEDDGLEKRELSTLGDGFVEVR